MRTTQTQTLTLIVEDDAFTRKLIAKALSTRNIETVEAATVGQGLVILERGPLPTTVILDLMLPDANGTILLRRIRRDDLPIRVAVVTGMPNPEAHLELGRFAPDRVFRKPLNLPDLLAWVEGEP